MIPCDHPHCAAGASRFTKPTLSPVHWCDAHAPPGAAPIPRNFLDDIPAECVRLHWFKGGFESYQRLPSP
jgi:hypothetical protein